MEVNEDHERFRDCSKYALKAGLSDEALNYARKELDLERLLIGTETVHLMENLDGARYWLEHVRNDIGYNQS